MTYIPQRDIDHLMEQLQPAAQFFKACVVDCESGEDPIEHFIQRHQEAGIDLQKTKKLLKELLPAFQWTWFFTQIGLTQELSFFSETLRRVEERFLPPLQAPTEVLYFLEHIFGDQSLDWLESVKAPQCQKLLSFFTSDDFHISESLSQSIQLSLEILAQRLSGLGLDTLIAKYLRDRTDLHREFLELGRHSFAEMDKNKALDNLIFLNGLKGCEKAVQYIRERTDSTGISLALTYRLVQIEELIARIKMLLQVLQASPGSDTHLRLGLLVKKILLEHADNSKVGSFLGRNVEILAYQITLLAERTGEHYIANNAEELRKMWKKAIKAAAVVAVLVVLKIMAGKMNFPPLLQALSFSMIYATGFVIIHNIGGTLATKQPAMTASTLAAAMDGKENSDEAIGELLEAVVRTLRTQISALLGNYIFAFPFAVLLVFPFLVLETPFINFAKSNALLEELHPLKSLSFMYAAITGFFLFLSGLISGLADNWLAFNQVGDRLDKILTSKYGKKFIASLRDNFGAWSGNVALGFMLGSMAALGTITGLPLDIRHITFASGAFGIGWIHQENMLPWSEFFILAASVLAMGLINLIVSFSLSLFVAMKSRRLQFHQGRHLLWLLLKRVLTRPHELFIHRSK